MSDPNISVTDCVVVEEEVQFTLVELSRACHAEIEQLLALVDEGVLIPRGNDPERWCFDGTSLQRTRAALRLTLGEIWLLRELDNSSAIARVV